MSLVIGTFFFAVFFGGILYATARRWRYLSMSYAGSPDQPIEKRSLQSAILLGLGGYNSIKGIITIAAHRTGVSFRILPPFNIFHEPLFIPYADIRGWQTTWYLDAQSTELEFRRAPDVKMIVSAEQAEWIKKHSGQRLELHDTPPPKGKSGRGWYAFAILWFVMSLLMIATMVWFLLTGQVR